MNDAREILFARTRVDEASGCWIWLKTRNRDGYGCLGFGGKQHLAHRLSYEVHCGPLPRGTSVCHHCDKPACINPDHLFLGTQADNISDMVAKGRQARGRRVSGAKLNERDVSAIRAAIGPRGLHTALAKKFGVSSQQIADIRKGKYWGYSIAPELKGEK